MRRLKFRRFIAIGSALAVTVAAACTATAPARTSAHRVLVSDYRLPASTLAKLRADFLNQLASRYPEHSWAPLRFSLSNRDLRLMGLPSKRWLIRHRHTFGTPTAVYRNGRTVKLAMRSSKRHGGSSSSSGQPTSSPGLVTFAGTGFFGIRPGAWLLLITKNSIGWCSMAHVYGTPGAYQISTAGHCGKPGDLATAIGLVGNRNPVLLDFGTFAVSHSAGLGADWALISIFPQDQPLVTPTIAFWGGPEGMY